VTKPGMPQGDMYISCLDCGKRFHYDWELMRIGSPADEPATADSLEFHSKGTNRKPKLRYLAAACLLPILWLVGKAAFHGKGSDTEKSEASKPNL
jgi:hypothetical protein